MSVSARIDINAPQTLDGRRMKVVSGVSVPYASIAEAHAAQLTFKHPCREMVIDDGTGPKVYWYVGGTAQTNLVPQNPGGSGSTNQIAATYSAIGSSTTPRFVYVSADENNNNDASLYIHTGTTLKFLLTVPA